MHVQTGGRAYGWINGTDRCVDGRVSGNQRDGGVRWVENYWMGWVDRSVSGEIGGWVNG